MALNKHLDALEAQSIYILREAYNKVKPLTLLWSIGKDSNVMLWLARKAFFGKVPFPVTQLDTEMELPEVYAFRDSLVKDWELDLKIELCPPEEDMDKTLPPATRAAMRKTEGLKNLLDRQGYKGIVAGIRRDEQSMRAKERVFSPRSTHGDWDFKNQPAEMWDQFKTDVPEGCHLRIHPILHWTEIDIWHYTQREKIPVVPLYFAKDGKRYRSLGEKNITHPVESKADSIDAIIAELEETKVPERAGRSMDSESEDSFETLRARGYM